MANWTPGDKEGFGTATAAASKVWFTLGNGELTEVYSPDLGTPSLRDLQFVVSDGATFTEREREDAVHRTELAGPGSLTYRQVNTARSGRWRITKTYVADPARSAVLADVTFESLTGRPYQLYVLADPARAVAATANSGLLLPEQVWDQNPPSGQPGYPPGRGTFSATPLGWTHARFIRLAWSIDAGYPVERPAVVACRYAQLCG